MESNVQAKRLTTTLHNRQSDMSIPRQKIKHRTRYSVVLCVWAINERSDGDIGWADENGNGKVLLFGERAIRDSRSYSLGSVVECGLDAAEGR